MYAYPAWIRLLNHSQLQRVYTSVQYVSNASSMFYSLRRRFFRCTDITRKYSSVNIGKFVTSSCLNAWYCALIHSMRIDDILHFIMVSELYKGLSSMTSEAEPSLPISNEVSTSATPASSPPTPVLANLPHLVTVKLTYDNYILWCTQLLPYFHGQCLYGYLDGPADSKCHYFFSFWASHCSSYRSPHISLSLTALKSLFATQSQSRLMHL